MIFQSLASSSSGNAYLVSDGHTNILIECGLTHKKLQQMCHFQTTGFDGCIISHEHKDHSQAVKQLIQSGMDVYMSYGTAEALELPEAVMELATEIVAGEQFTIGTIDVMPFGTFHDAFRDRKSAFGGFGDAILVERQTDDGSAVFFDEREYRRHTLFFAVDGIYHWLAVVYP